MNHALRAQLPQAPQTRSACLLIRVDPIQLLVPRVLVAEVVNLQGTALTAGPVREIRFFEWRGLQVPLVHPTVIDARCAQALSGASKIVVFHGLLNRARLPFHALAVTRNPRLLLLSSATLREEPRGEGDTPTLNWVQVESERAAIPKVDHVENFVLENLAP